MRYRLAPDAAIAVDGEDVLVLHDGVPVATLPGAANAVAAVVDALAGPREEDELWTSPVVSATVDALLTAGGLVPAPLVDELVELHARTVGPTHSLREAAAHSRTQSPEPAVDTAWLLREHGQGAELALPAAAPVTNPLEDVIARRSSARSFASRGCTVADLATLLWWACGPVRPDGLRTYPSGGSLHPVEVYVVPVRVDALDLAVYRYRPAGHALVHRRPPPPPEAVRAWFADVDAGASAVVLLLGVDLSRHAFARYGGKAYRLALLEAGHVAQNVLLVATALGMAGTALCGFADEAIARAAGMSPPEEVLVYAVVLGAP